jgi:hypothetical protein
MISFGSWILNVICNNCEIRNNLHLSWHGKVYSSIWKDHPLMIITSFVMPIRLKLRSSVNIGRQITFPSPKVYWLHRHLPHQPLSQGLVRVLPLLGVVAMIQLLKFLPLLTLPLIFLRSFAPIIKVWRLRNSIHCKSFNVDPMRVYKRHTHECGGWLMWPRGSHRPKLSSFGMGS